MEVDASDLGVEAVLSRCQVKTIRFIPVCTSHANFPEQRRITQWAGGRIKLWTRVETMAAGSCYQTGSKNIKPDTVSHLHLPESDPEPLTPSLPITCFVGAITWEFERKVKEPFHGFPKNILSNRGPKCIAQFWRAFFKVSCDIFSLNSGYHNKWAN